MNLFIECFLVITSDGQISGLPASAERLTHEKRFCLNGKRMDKLGALKMFVVTAQLGSFSRAAEQLGKTPSALTKAVNHLEAELGAFVRAQYPADPAHRNRPALPGNRTAGVAAAGRGGEEIEQLQHGCAAV
jgi:hypothetical protein